MSHMIGMYYQIESIEALQRKRKWIESLLPFNDVSPLLHVAMLHDIAMIDQRVQQLITRKKDITNGITK